MEHFQLQNWAEDRARPVRLSLHGPGKGDRSHLRPEEDRHGAGEGGADGRTDHGGDQAAAVHELSQHPQALRLLSVGERALPDPRVR